MMKFRNENRTRISLAYSPDTDDAFMVTAMQEGGVDLGPYEFDYHVDDIQVLNDAALEGRYDITAISVAAWPSISATYKFMPIGGSIGDAFGPAVVVSPASSLKDLSDLHGKKVAIPGLKTSAYFAAMALTGGFVPVPMYFKRILDAVKDGTVDAGVLIHERQLDCDVHGVKKISDLGAAWSQKFDLPLPLGSNAIRRSLGADVIADLSAIYRASIVAGLADRKETLKKALARSKAGIDEKLGDRYISMYVNSNSLDFSDLVVQGTQKLYDEAARFGLCSPKISIDFATDQVPGVQ